MKQLLSILLAFALICPTHLLMAGASDEDSHPVRVILKDGSVLNGELLGMDEGVLLLQTKSGKSKDIPFSAIKKVFDADGNPVALGAAAKPKRSVEEPKEEAVEEESPAPRRRARRVEPARHGSNGAKIAGIILDCVGLVGFLGGMAVEIDGQNAMDAATSTYYSSYWSGAPYNIDGKYYTYSQYTAYYYGESERNTGLGVMVVGGVLLITGIIVGTAGSKGDQAGLMNVGDGKLAWKVPAVSIDPVAQRSKLTLLTAQF